MSYGLPHVWWVKDKFCLWLLYASTAPSTVHSTTIHVSIMESWDMWHLKCGWKAPVWHAACRMPVVFTKETAGVSQLLDPCCWWLCWPSCRWGEMGSHSSSLPWIYLTKILVLRPWNHQFVQAWRCIVAVSWAVRAQTAILPRRNCSLVCRPNVHVFKTLWPLGILAQMLGSKFLRSLAPPCPEIGHWRRLEGPTHLR